MWQRAAAAEERRLRHFCVTQLGDIASTAMQYLAMLSLVRALLCAPDQYSTVTAYSEVRRMVREMCPTLAEHECIVHRIASYTTCALPSSMHATRATFLASVLFD